MRALHLYTNQLTGKHFFDHMAQLVYECTKNLKRPSCCTGNIPTELGLCTAMNILDLRRNGLTGKHFFAHMARLVYEYTRVYQRALWEQMHWCQPAQRACVCVQWELAVRHASWLLIPSGRPSRVQDAHASEAARVRPARVIVRQPTLVRGRAGNACGGTKTTARTRQIAMKCTAAAEGKTGPHEAV